MNDLDQLRKRLHDAVGEARTRHDWRVRAFVSVLEQFRHFLGGEPRALVLVASDQVVALDDPHVGKAFTEEVKRHGLRARVRLQLDAESRTHVDAGFELEQSESGALVLYVAGAPFPIAAVSGEALRPAYTYYKKRVAELLDSHSAALVPNGGGPRALALHEEML